MTGTAFAWFAPLMLRLTSAESPLPMSASESSWIVSSIEFGEVLSVLPAGMLADKWGRKTLVLSGGPMCIVGFLLKATTRSIPILYFVRFIQGLALGIAYTVCPIYIAEIADPKIRGILSCHFQTLWYAGALFAYAVGPYVDYQSYAYICMTLPVLFMVTFWMMPETPYFLLMKGRDKEAKAALAWFRASNNVDAEFKSIEETIQKEFHNQGSWKELFATKKDRKAFFVVQIVCLTKYMNGMSAVVTYSSQTFGQVASNYLGHNELTILIGLLLTIVTFLSSFMSDSIGRRPLLIFSSLTSGICLVVLGTYYFVEFETTVDTKAIVWISYASLTLFCIAANVGLGPLMQTIQAEFFSSNTRGIGGGLTEILASVGAFLCIKQYQMVQDAVGVFLNYWIYATVCFLGAIALYIFLPETSGKSLGEIQGDMEKSENGIMDEKA